MPAGHSMWPASSFHRTIDCPGATALIQLLQENPEKVVPGCTITTKSSSAYAAEGTVAHSVLEAMVLHKPLPPVGTVVQEDGHEITVDEDMLSFVRGVYERALKVADGCNGVLFPEIHSDYSAFIGVAPGTGWGTSDIVTVADDLLIVTDLKYGRGVQVFAENNPQLSLYALGAWSEFTHLAGDVKRLRMVIDQPRIGHYDEWETSIAALQKWAHTVAAPAVKAAIEAKAKFKSLDDEKWESKYLHCSLDACRFCPIAPICPALKRLAVKAAGRSEQELVAENMKLAEVLEPWCLAVRSFAEGRLIAGEPVDGYKLVRGRAGNRTWDNPETVARIAAKAGVAHDVIYESKIRTPAQLFKAAPQAIEVLQPHIVQAEGKLSIAPESDKRPAVAANNVVDDFSVESS